MSKYGLKIKNYQAASIYEYNHGLRNKYDYTDAMLVNSLFLDFLLKNGLTTWKGESTRDVICLEFGYGTKSYSETISKIKSKETDENVEYIENAIQRIENNKEYCIKYDKKELRTKFYVEGLDIKYPVFGRGGKVISEEIIHYKMLYRTPGKAKKGTCMFINEKLYDVVHNFLYMGITLPEINSPIIQMGAYSSLITSGIVGRIKILPEQILVLSDIDCEFVTNVVTVNTNSQKHCVVEHEDNYTVKNTIFDGQALIDSSIFPEYLDNGEKADGYILLRQHMTKCAAFNTNIEKFMREYYGDLYESAIVKDMWGREVKVSDIKLITTESAMKWLTFDVSFEYWAEKVRELDCIWGIVKTTHESKFGDVQRMSYQMTNSLNLENMNSVVEKSVEYINKLKSDDETFLNYLRDGINFSNDYDVLLALVEHNPDFIKSDYFRDRKRKIIEAYVLNFKSGRTLQNADNLTIIGSPYAMLLHSVGEDIYNDPTFNIESGTIQCWTERFGDGEYLAEFRSPFNSRNNLGYCHNHYHEYFDKYFKFGKLVIAVNVIGTDWQDRNNGADQDSDSCYTTNQVDIVEHARRCYKDYPTIVNKIPKEKNSYNYTMEDFAEVDNKLAAAQMAIGESSNLAQLCLTYTYNFNDEKYSDYVCALSVLAQVAIDNAKRKFDIDLTDEIRYIKKDMNIEDNGLPYFWLITKKDKRKARNDEERKDRKKKNKQKIKENLNTSLVCPMNYLYNLDLTKYRSTEKTIPISEFFIKHEQDNNRRKSKAVEELIEKYSFDLYTFYVNYKEYNWEEDNVSKILNVKFDELIEDIKSVYISKNYLGLMSWLINRAFCIGAGVKRNVSSMDSNTEKNKSLLLKVLYTINKDAFLECFRAQLSKNDNEILS